MTRVYTGIVTAGTRRATKLGFPTINIPLTNEQISGIYAGTIEIDGSVHVAAVYADQKRKVLETHVVGFPNGITEGTVTVTLIKKIREDAAFTDDEALKMAIANDIEQVKALSME